MSLQNRHLEFELAIAENPRDSSLRLIYADWLEEQGDLRSEFIRVMEKMKKLPIYCDECWQLRTMRNDLRNRIDKAWLKKMQYHPVYSPMFSKLPTERKHRWRLVEEFISLWYEPLQEGDGYSESELASVEDQIGLQFPTALRELYSLCGKREDIWCTQNRLLSPQEILQHFQFEGSNNLLWQGTIDFFVENQGVEIWGVCEQDTELEDPPVYSLREHLGEVSPTISAFVILALLSETQWAAPIRGSWEIPSESMAEHLSQSIQRCDLPNRYWISFPIDYYEKTDLYFSIANLTDSIYLNVIARNNKALSQLDSDIMNEILWTTFTY